MLYFFPILANGIRLVLISALGNEVLNNLNVEQSVLFKSTSGKALFKFLKVFHLTTPPKSLKEMPSINYPYWIIPNLNKYRVVKDLDDILFYWSDVFVLLSLVPAAIIQATAKTHRVGMDIDINNCFKGEEMYYIYAVALLFVFIISPGVLITIKNVRESHGIVSELFLTTASNIVFVSLYTIWQVGVAEWKPDIYMHFPPQAWLIIMTLFSFIISIIRPLIQSMKSPPEYKERSQFDFIMNNTTLFEIFKESTIADFTTQYIIFELHMQEVMDQSAKAIGMNNVPSDMFVSEDILVKYGEIFRLYFCYDSPFYVCYF